MKTTKESKFDQESMDDHTMLSTADKSEVLKNFMEEFFDFDSLVEVGFFTKEMKGDYQSQAERVCKYFGFKTVYEYGAKEVRAHISYAGERPKETEFVEVIPSIYE